MAVFSISNIKISGVSAAIPLNEESNQDIPTLTEEDKRLLIKTTGIDKRRVSKENQFASDFCEAAAKKILSDLSWNPEDVDVLVFVTQTPDYLIPGTSNILQKKLGLSNKCMSIDITQGCSGYVYGLSIISSLISAGGLKKGLLLVGDTITKVLEENDNGTVPIFSDAGSATALEFDKKAQNMWFNLQSDGDGFDTIIDRSRGHREGQKPGNITDPNLIKLKMKGHNVFTFSLKEVVPNVQKLMEIAGVDNTAIDFFVFHQANLLLNESLRKKLKVEKEKVPYSLVKYGNTSCATIPLTIVSELRDKVSKGSHKIVLSGFGVGLSWGSVLVNISDISCSELIEL
ncbi:MAG: 3-oxoacyl-[acyl-carrier-protein] synthase-3 [Arenicella sp.]|jgi:3-oxoacyl-[acyl-carrier-protein] synthase-3